MTAQSPYRVTVRQCDGGDPRWLIADIGPLRDPHAQGVDWSRCPGSLHESYESAWDACAAARWWGYDPEVVRHSWEAAYAPGMTRPEVQGTKVGWRTYFWWLGRRLRCRP